MTFANKHRCKGITKAGKRCWLPAGYNSPNGLCPMHRLTSHHKKRKLVYFVEANGLVKIGSTNNLNTRLGTMMPGLILLGTTKEFSELTVHRALCDLRVKGEWFKKSERISKFITEKKYDSNTH